MTALDDAFTAWKSRALDVPLLEAAAAHGAQLKRLGQEHVGPCPVCQGKDTFAINEARGVFVCRKGDAGGDVISLTRHLAGVDFIGACEILTGEPSPKGQGRGLTPEELAERDERRRRHEAAEAQRRADESARRARRAKTAMQIWQEARPIAGTLAERYLVGRGIPVPPDSVGWPVVLGFHEGLPYHLGATSPDDAPIYPALVALVQGPEGKPSGIWRVFLDSEGRKAPVENPKLGLGDVAGGAVRLGGDAAVIGAAEGIETALAVWTLKRYARPIWATLSTSGMKGLEPPVSVGKIVIYPDGDYPIERKDGTFGLPPGIAAARGLKERMDPAGVLASIAACPDRADFLDVLQDLRRVSA